MNQPFEPIVRILSGCKRVLVSTHVRPDGDALGSCAGLVLGLRAKGIAGHVVLLSKLPSKYAFLFHDAGISYSEVDGSTWPTDVRLDTFDALLVVDTGTRNQLPVLADRLAAFGKPKLVLDHHLTQEDWADVKVVMTHAAAAGEIVAGLLDAWGVAIDRAIAAPLFLALVADTGWFQFANTKPATLRLAARLMETGVDTDELYQLIYQNERAERVLLQTRGQQSLELLADKQIAVMSLRKSDFEECRARVTDTEALVNIPLQIRTVAVGLLFTEPPEGGDIRVSLRSKGTLDVARFAEQFGGGGHARAAGLKLAGSLDEVKRRVSEALVAAVAGSPGSMSESTPEPAMIAVAGLP